MMKRVFQSCATVFVLFLLGGVAVAIPVTDNTDYLTANSITFWNAAEFASYESDFGMFSMTDASNKYQIFSYDDEFGALSTIAINASDWGALGTGFGFYFDVHTGGSSDTSADYTWYSDSSLNQYFEGALVDTNVNHVAINLTSQNIIWTYLDDQLGGGDQDFNDMIVLGVGCKITSTSPVPEPATLALFGTGLVSLAGFSRKKKAPKQ